MRHHFFPRDAMRWREDVQMGARLQAVTDTHKRELDALKCTLGRRVEAAERLLSLILFEQEAARRQIKVLAEEVRGLREAVLVVRLGVHERTPLCTQVHRETRSCQLSARRGGMRFTRRSGEWRARWRQLRSWLCSR